MQYIMFCNLFCCVVIWRLAVVYFKAISHSKRTMLICSVGQFVVMRGHVLSSAVSRNRSV
jgi:hypothetical protein